MKMVVYFFIDIMFENSVEMWNVLVVCGISMLFTKVLMG